MDFKVRRFIKFFVIVFVGCSVLLITGCAKKEEEPNNNSIPTNPTPTATATSLADSYFSVSTTDLVVTKGSTATFDLVITNAVGRFDISSSDVSIATVDKDTTWLEGIDGESETKSITVSGIETGTTQIIINLSDVASYDTEEELTGTYIINVTVE